MHLNRFYAHPAKHAATAIVLLPAAQSSPAELEREGFVTAVQARKLDIDLILPDLPFGSVIDGSVLETLHREAIAPARETYTTLWVMGISIGGYLAIAYDERYPGNLDGLCLIAPYPGSRIVWGEVASCGSIEQWQPQEITDDDHERRVWRWLKQRRQHPIKLHLGYGREDRFAKGQSLMASALADDTVDTIPGEHYWPVWLTLWHRFLDRTFVPSGARG